MKPLNLISIPENDTQPRSIEVTDQKEMVLAKVWADQTITVNEPQDFFLEEISQLQVIAQNFYLFYNNIKTAK